MLLFSIFVIGHLFWTRMVATAGDLKLSVEPQSGSVNTGDQVTFLCTIAGSEAGITFFLYKEGDKQRRMINSSEKAIEGKFQFRVQGSDEGTYYCVYDTEQFTSVAYSNRVKITVRGKAPTSWRDAIMVQLCRVQISFHCFEEGSQTEKQKKPIRSIPNQPQPTIVWVTNSSIPEERQMHDVKGLITGSGTGY
ncbi:hypothetical protein chiPu_0016811, partial [Chiloscyllium punctatum]|nr:hypothetical protein [Chiloscyllium punctatum]